MPPIKNMKRSGGADLNTGVRAEKGTMKRLLSLIVKNNKRLLITVLI